MRPQGLYSERNNLNTSTLFYLQCSISLVLVVAPSYSLFVHSREPTASEKI